MIDLRIQLEGMREFQQAARRNPQAVRALTEDVANAVRKIAIGNTPVKTGETKRRWSEVSFTGGGFSFGLGVDHAVVLEQGLYRNVGPRTVETEAGIFSRQAPSGMISPILADEQLLINIINRVAGELTKGYEDL